MLASALAAEEVKAGPRRLLHPSALLAGSGLDFAHEAHLARVVVKVYGVEVGDPALPDKRSANGWLRAIRPMNAYHLDSLAQQAHAPEDWGVHRIVACQNHYVVGGGHRRVEEHRGRQRHAYPRVVGAVVAANLHLVDVYLVVARLLEEIVEGTLLRRVEARAGGRNCAEVVGSHQRHVLVESVGHVFAQYLGKSGVVDLEVFFA